MAPAASAGSATAIVDLEGNVVSAGRGATFVNGQFVGGNAWGRVNGAFNHWGWYGGGCVAMKIGGDNDLVVETGLYNLTNDEAPVFVHFSPDRQEVRTFVRLKQLEEKGVGK